jgi:hypothetical protein
MKRSSRYCVTSEKMTQEEILRCCDSFGGLQAACNSSLDWLGVYVSLLIFLRLNVNIILHFLNDAFNQSDMRQSFRQPSPSAQRLVAATARAETKSLQTLSLL